MNSRIFQVCIIKFDERKRIKLMNVNEFGGKNKIRNFQICQHFVAQIAHQINRQSWLKHVDG